MTYRQRVGIFVLVLAMVAVGRFVATLWMHGRSLEAEARGVTELAVARTLNHMERWRWLRGPNTMPDAPSSMLPQLKQFVSATALRAPSPLLPDLSPPGGWLCIRNKSGRITHTTEVTALRTAPSLLAEGSTRQHLADGREVMVTRRRLLLASALQLPDLTVGPPGTTVISYLSRTPRALPPGSVLWLEAVSPMGDRWRGWTVMAGVEVGLLMLVGALLWLAHREVARGLNRVAVMAAEVRAMNDRQALASFVLGPHPHDELDQLKETFNQLFERVEATGSIQRRFLADAAHELRAPLSGLLYQLRLIVRRGAARPDSIATWAHTAMAEADRLHRLVDDMLDLTTIEAGVAPLRPTRLDLTALCREEVARQRERHARLQWAGMDDAVWIEADPDRVRQVLHNLLTNALRATETQGTVVVEVRSGLGHGELVVRDTGVGMTEDVRANMFNRFYRGERTGRDGVGIGLAIVAEILRQHDASISVESRPWQGTNAYVHWPDKLP